MASLTGNITMETEPWTPEVVDAATIEEQNNYIKSRIAIYTDDDLSGSDLHGT